MTNYDIFTKFEKFKAREAAQGKVSMALGARAKVVAK